MSVRIAVLASGEGSNLQAVLDAVAAGELEAEVVAVLSDKPSARALERADEAGVSTAVASFAPYRAGGLPREAYDADLARLVAAFEPDIVLLAGFLRVLSPAFLDVFPGRVINLHPALPGAYPGLHAIRRAWEAADGAASETGVMVHVVVPEVDAGPVLGVRAVPVDEGMSLEALEQRVHEAEHALLVQVLRKLSSTREAPGAEA